MHLKRESCCIQASYFFAKSLWVVAKIGIGVESIRLCTGTDCVWIKESRGKTGRYTIKKYLGVTGLHAS
ncbi:MAG: hypothetical protein ACI8P9_000711 [Parasphingorhabdus sp.]|jgi:hypothetical protein